MTQRRLETVPPALHGERVDRVVALVTGLSRSQVADLMAAGRVRVGERIVTTRGQRLAEGDQLEVAVPDAAVRPGLDGDPAVQVSVVYADSSVIVVEKAAGVVVHPGSGRATGTLVQGLLHRFPELARVGGDPQRPGIVHRLDKGTSGLLAVARTPAALASLVDQLERRTVERRYLALVWGHLGSGQGMVDAPVGRAVRDPTRMAVTAGGRAARTRYTVIEQGGEPAVSLLECRLETGRTHQIRVHLSTIGHPVVGDDRYGGRSLPGADRPFLHAHHLAFDHPADGRRLSFGSGLPDDLRAVLAGTGLRPPGEGA